MTTQVFVASTAFGLATLVAALEDGLYPPADRRVLLLSNNATVPETSVSIAEVAGMAQLLARFDAVHDYNDAIAPQHPSLWSPRTVDLPVLERLLTGCWSLSGDLHLVVECLWTAPSLTLCRIFADARIDAYADGLMSYGPTRTALPALVGARVERLLHLDLVPGLRPVLLSELGVPAQTISTEAFRKVIATLDPPPAAVADAAPGSVAVLLGQYLAALDILTEEEEADLHRAMVDGAVAAGFRSLVFKPHPGAPPRHGAALRQAAAEVGATLTVADQPALVETWFRAPGVGCVVGCFSTALLTASTCYDLPSARVGTDLLMARLRPYENSNRIPLTLVDALLPEVGRSVASPPSVAVEQLVHAVAYCMQPERYPELRPAAETLLAASWPGLRRYFRRRRLTLLDLPGRQAVATAPAFPPAGLRRAARRLLGRTASRRVSRVLRRWRSAGAAG